MHEPLELIIASPDGIIDCRAEPVTDGDGNQYFSVTILYPQVLDGFSRSEIFCHDMRLQPETKTYHFDANEADIHPKILKLEKQVSDEIINNI